ncbi:MAG: ABC transporter permease [Spirochaetes bacterium]|nr:ABC transporter permease [Spirochaetota bacterium]
MMAILTEIRKNAAVILPAAIIMMIAVSSIFPDEISGHSPFAIDLKGSSSPGRVHLLGTDFLGRDILSRTVVGGRISILIGVIARLGAVIVGLIAGLASGLSSRRVRPLIDGAVEVFLAIPSLLLAMGLAVVLGEGYTAIVIAIIVGTWAPVARFTSIKVIEINNKDFVTSARVIGAGYIRIVAVYIMPHLLPVLLPVITTGIATSIMMESTLTFLGLAGSSSIDTVPSWGQMIQEGSKFIFDAPWLILPPSIILMILILCFNLIGDKIAAENA